MTTLNIRAIGLRQAAVALGMALATTHAAWAAASSAFGVQADFTWKHVKTGVAPIGSVSGSAPPAYSKHISIGQFQQTVPLLPSEGSNPPPVPTLTVGGEAIKANVASSGGTSSSASASAAASVTGIAISLALPPTITASRKTPIDIPFLDISAKQIGVSTSLNPTSALPAELSSSASISGLVINGLLVGEQAITFSGSVRNNTVLFQSDTVTITVNTKLAAGVISCSPKCVLWPATVTGSALDISLNNADLDGNIVSGDIIVAQGQAGSLGLVSRPAELPAVK